MNPLKIENGILFAGDRRILLRSVQWYAGGGNPNSVIIHLENEQVTLIIPGQVQDLFNLLDSHFARVWDDAKDLIAGGLGRGGKIVTAIQSTRPPAA